ncbi:beta-glucan synthesis-associated protein KRE6 [Phytophthora infestans T30-4]|uniref:Beta-glucan synthesis-associated protein KRE6 n=1 Tax=Phytophthora infestans (strain T30-4) TaxID=403677 RepID=D0NXZ0_PHYIT|nr:beta-glucan synthesis-associated protein KRE6 [Phytophthora infestans T30-4]EEY67941.1 beta-glucan synthesis-associated protein KRE6 [Phytophthora infestans T30-4]|eukprot:XP_002997803.1 beta-glucan synthesis-associated protein KRE6 [Phytophthora infestans T30-4]
MHSALFSCSTLALITSLVSSERADSMIKSRSGLSPWVDVDTPESALNVTSSRGDTWTLVMSDEFNVPGRNFTPGSDHMWTALEMPDGVNAALEYYSFNMTDTVTESDGRGVFRIKIMEEDNITYTVWNTYAKPAGFETHHMYYRAGMVQSWNKFCFQGGRMEVVAQLPATTSSSNPDMGDIKGRVKTNSFYPTWPGIWLLGNLGRALFSQSTSRMWPWSYDECDEKFESSQRISACDGNPGSGLNAHQGRGAPEIDLLEGGGVAISTSIQVAPGMPDKFRIIAPTDDKSPFCVFTAECTTIGANFPGIPAKAYEARDYESWYQGLRSNKKCSSPLGAEEPKSKVMEPFEYQMDALSANWPVQLAAYTSYVKYQVEWVMGSQGYIRWMVEDIVIFEIPAESVENVPQDAAKSNPKKLMLEEPMYVIFNVALSTSWGTTPPNPGSPCRGDGSNAQHNAICDGFPMFMKIDYIRIYQDLSSNSTMAIGCDPSTHPTKQWIEDHIDEYETTENKWIEVHGGANCKTDNDFITSLVGAFVIVLLVFVVYKIMDQRSKKAMVGAGITQPAILSKIEMDDIPRSNKSQSGSEDKVV